MEPPIGSVEFNLGETMSVTRTTVLIGIMCSVWMTFPLTANAFDLAEFVGLTDRGSTKVKTCVDEKEAGHVFSILQSRRLG
jgi:hypothetical protein